MLFRLLTLIGGLGTLVSQEIEETPPEEEKSPLIAVDPLELEYLKRTSKSPPPFVNVDYQAAKYYVAYLTNVTSRDAYFLATYEPQRVVVKLSPNMSNCIYDVTNNAQFDDIKRPHLLGVGIIWVLLLLQCPPGECLEADIGCLNPPVDKNLYYRIGIFALVVILTILCGLVYKRRQISDWWTYLMKTRKRFHCRKGNYQPPAEGH